MQFLKSMLLLLVIMVGILIAACEPANDNTAALPTVITLLPPIITETPRFTATLPPSETPTPSDTPTPTTTATPVSPTPTFTITPTPPEFAQVISQDDARVRAEPLANGEILTTILPGTRVEVHYASEDEQWYFVRLIDVDGSLVEGWMRSNLLGLLNESFVPPTQGPTPTPTDTLDASQVLVTGTPSTPVAGVGEDLSEVNVRANCRQTNTTVPRVSADQTVSIWWSWFVTRPELMDEHIAHVEYEVLLDGRLLENYEQYQTELQQEGRDWYVYWYVPVGTLTAGRHEVTYRVTWDAPVNDGANDFGPGTETEFEESNCVFTVQE